LALIYDFPRDHIFWDLVEKKEVPAEIIPLSSMAKQEPDTAASWTPEVDNEE